jgi:hypothetical protein
MKIRIMKGVFLHLGEPWKDGSLTFPESTVRDWKVARLYGLSVSRWRYFFLGFMKLDPKNK